MNQPDPRQQVTRPFNAALMPAGRADLLRAMIGRGAAFRDPRQVMVFGLPGAEEADGQQYPLRVWGELQEHRPDLVIWENVRGLLAPRNNDRLHFVLDVLDDWSYQWVSGLLEPARFRTDSPKRLWIVATRRDIDMPEQPRMPTRSVPSAPGANPYLTAILAANHY